MAIDLLSVIRDDSALKSGGFTGAVFLTYSLNLTFFEQIVTPALDQAGCSNVLILCDIDGYNQALELGSKSVQGVGLRYVCAPILRTGWGLQHAKALFMVAPKGGRLLLGSGNLTFHGYGRNLELYSLFQYDTSDEVTDNSPFLEVWKLIQYLAVDSDLPFAAKQQINSIQEKVGWLKDESSTFPPVIWHNYERPLWDQLTDWRRNQGFVEPVHRIKAISPYYDCQLTAIQEIVTDTSPSQMQIHFDPGLTNLDGTKATQVWQKKSPKLNAFAITPSENQDSRRHVHAKAIIGQEKNGSWCISGSANLSQPALLSTWQTGGNLEMVTFHWSENPKEFDYLLKDEMIQVWSLDLSTVVASETEPSERKSSVHGEIFLTDLNWQDQKLMGRVSRPLPADAQDIKLHLQRRNADVPVRFQDDRIFIASIESSFVGAEFARLETNSLVTPYRWIDHPSVLARYGARTYHVRIKGKLETLLGAEKLFQELMNFLWDRIEIDSIKAEHDFRLQRRSVNKGAQDTEKDGNEPLPPGAEAFITEEELVRTLQSRIDNHHPYDRSLLSLRDLLSLVLMRLTVATQVASIGDQDDRNEEEDERKQDEKEKLQRNIVERLRYYLINYCSRYADRLIDLEFIRKVPPETIFQNQYTLGRVLLEFANKASNVFTPDDLFRCFWLIWAPLVWPEVIRRTGLPTLKILTREPQPERIREAWQKAGMPTLVNVMFSEVLGQPPSWKAGLWVPDKVETFVVANEWIKRIKNIMGENSCSGPTKDLADVFGLISIDNLFSNGQVSSSYLQYLQENFAKIERYLPPVEEKYAPLIELSRLERSRSGDASKNRLLIDQICAQGLEKELALYKANPNPIVRASEDEDALYCPRCGAELTTVAEDRMIKGNLALCPSTGDAWIYLSSELPEAII